LKTESLSVTFDLKRRTFYTDKDPGNKSKLHYFLG